MRHLFLAPVVSLSLLTGCATGVGTQSDLQRLRDAQARLAISEARAQCVVATNLPPENKIVETCVRGMVPDLYQQIVARDNAQLERDAPPVSQPTKLAPPIEAVSPSLPQTQPAQPAPAVQPVSPPVNLSDGPSVAPAGLPFGNRTLVYGPNGGLEVYTPPPAPVPYTGFPSVQPSFGPQP